MTYISGQPIVFVGTGQTYTDLKSLNAKVNLIIISRYLLKCDEEGFQDPFLAALSGLNMVL